MKTAVLFISTILVPWSPLPVAMAEQDVFSELSAEFDLLDADGVEVSLSDYRGKNVLLTFGFTHCGTFAR